jgi:class 3 adenylate cyclase
LTWRWAPATIEAVPRIQRKSFTDPDEVRPFVKGTGAVARLGPFVVGHAVLEPGWRWSLHMQPVMGTPSCPVHHLQFMLSGRLHMRMDDGEEIELVPNDIADIPAGHDAWVVGNEPVVVLDLSGNIDEIGLPREHSRVVVTLMMTDIVGSTAEAERLGDKVWKQVLADHNRVVRAALARFDGTEITTTGDGFLATFPTAAGALRCGATIREVVREVGVQVRIGVHTGEIEMLSDGIGGIAVHAVARIMALAGSSEILASSLAVALVEGSGLAFEIVGEHAVKGIERPIEVQRLVR